MALSFLKHCLAIIITFTVGGIFVFALAKVTDVFFPDIIVAVVTVIGIVALFALFPFMTTRFQVGITIVQYLTYYSCVIGYVLVPGFFLKDGDNLILIIPGICLFLLIKVASDTLIVQRFSCHNSLIDRCFLYFNKISSEIKIPTITMGDHITIQNINGNFINKSYLNNSLNGLIDNGLNADQKQDLLNIAAAIEKQQDIAAATIFDKFTAEINKPKAEQQKPAVKSLWDGLVKIMPDAVSLGSSIAKLIALF